MAAKCGACGKYISAADGAKCSKCSVVYDRACVALPATGRIITTWVCPTCTAKIPRNNDADTPVKGMSGKSTIVDDKPSVKNVSNSEGPQVELALQMQLLRQEIVDFRRELAEIKLNFSVYDNRLTDIENRLGKMEQRSAHDDQQNGSELGEMVSKLQSELNDRDQEMLLNDVEITNVPENKGENSIHLVTLISSKLGFVLEERDIVSAVRVGPLKTNEGQNGNNNSHGGPRPRPLVVRLTRRSLREEFLRQARVRRGATTTDLSLQQEPRRFYVNERLTRHNRYLFHKAREEARQQSWKYVWTRDGRIYARQEQGKQSLRIKSESDIIHIFKKPVVGSNTK